MKKNIIFFVCIVMLSGCVESSQYSVKTDEILDPIVVFRSFSSYYLLSCLNDSQNMGPEKFDATFRLAQEGLQHGTDLDKLRFICLSMNANADYKQFQQGNKVFEQYLDEHPDSGNDMQGLSILVNRLDEEIMNRWSAWKTLLEEKKELMEQVKSLQSSLEQVEVKNEELQNKIEQLKNIENIIKSRGTGQP